jgi:hypothetical protein
MLGFYVCLYCQTQNACDCNTCSKHITEFDTVMIHADDGEAIICGNCKKVFSYEESLDAYDKLKDENNNKI